MECKLDQITVYYEEYGSGKPVIMLHGYYPDHRLMSGCMEPVFSKRQGYRRIYIDLPGMGKTKGELCISSSDQMLQVVLDFINKVIPDENFLLAGESYGGYLARGVVYHMPRRIDGMILLCPMVIAERKKRNIPAHKVIVSDSKFLSTLSEEEAADFASMAVVQNKEIWQRYNQEILSGVKIADGPFLEKFRSDGYPFTFDVDAVQEEFTKPVLFLLGRQDATVGYQDAWNILNNYPRASFVVLDKAGHNLQLEQAELFNCLANEWLNRVEELV